MVRPESCVLAGHRPRAVFVVAPGDRGFETRASHCALCGVTWTEDEENDNE